jgi:L,D-transpeptidase YcbB
MKPDLRFRILLLMLVAWFALSHGAPRSKTSGADAYTSAGTAPADGNALSETARAELQGILQTGYLSDLHHPSFHKHQGDVADFYAISGDRLPWLSTGKPTSQARALISELEQAEYKGLDPDDYDASAWDARASRLNSATVISDDDLVRFDLALTVSAMRYVSDLHLGRANPNTYHTALDIGSTTFSLAQFLHEQLVTSNDVSGAIQTLEPPIPPYQRSLAALQTYIELARANSFQPLPVPAKPVKPGDTYAALPQLSRLLMQLGDLPQSTQPPGDQANLYSGSIVSAVKHFQDRHGLAPTGRIDVATFAELNTPLTQRVTQLQLALERWRWLPHQFARPPIVVNIPEFQLHAIDDENQSAIVMKIVVGKALGHETPVLASAIDAVIFRPEWDVPYSIQAKEMIPDIKRKPGYLEKNSLEIVDHSGNLVTDSQVTPDLLAQLRSGKLAIRQKPGPDNSLGLIKFEFPNDFSVYMHGTPAMSLFSKSRRDFSHGCIRVEDPPKLAEWVLQGMPEWTPEKIAEAMNGDETLRVKVAHPVPVLIIYTTAVASQDGEIHFFKDIYGLDAKLQAELAHRYDQPQ